MKQEDCWVYKVKFKKQVIKFLQSQDMTIRTRILDFFDDIKDDPYNFKNYDVKMMQGLKNFYRLRISKYRVMFAIKDDVLIVEVVKAGSRGDVYK